MTIEERREAEFEKYRKVYRDYPLYCNRQIRIDLTREWLVGFGSDDTTPEAEVPGTLLDVGCGRGEVLAMARDELFMVRGCDVVPGLCQDADIDRIRGLHALPYADGEFDLVTCTDVLEHILEDDVPAGLSEIARVARGPVLLAICHIPDKPGKYGPDTLHITVKPREWWEDKIREHMDAEPRPLYLDRVNGNGTWFEVIV
jgi:ubiquinone/menaquinone biosynthesis C-methylase UbiE